MTSSWLVTFTIFYLKVLGSMELIQHTLRKCVVNDVQSMLGEMLSGLLFLSVSTRTRSVAQSCSQAVRGETAVGDLEYLLQ